MPDYRRNRVEGGCCFFTVNPRDRRSGLPVSEIGALREAVRETRTIRPFHIDAWVVLPDHLHCLWTAGDADFPLRWQMIKARFSRDVAHPDARRASLARKRETGVWQRRHWEHTIRDLGISRFTSGPIFHTVSYAISCGNPAITAVSIHSLEGLAGMAGGSRSVFSATGSTRKASLSVDCCAVAGRTRPRVRQRGGRVLRRRCAVWLCLCRPDATLFVIARENFQLRMMATIIGGSSMGGALGMAAGPIASGWIFDTFATYFWLYVMSCGLGIGSFLIAMTFEPFPNATSGAGAAASLSAIGDDLGRERR
jgi:REP element-mobilizing transposase RayT